MDKAEDPELEDIFAANADLEQRLMSLSVNVGYDDEFDIFLLTIGEPQPAFTEPIRDGLQLRIDPETLKIVGIEVLGFKRRYLKANPEFRTHFESLFAKSPLQLRDIPGHGQQRERVQRAARELIPV